MAVPQRYDIITTKVLLECLRKYEMKDKIVISVITGAVLDLAFGDPALVCHPVRAIGKLTEKSEYCLRRVFPETKKAREPPGRS